MNFRSLAIFTAVCEEKSMTAAARRLHLAQPSVSLAIRELETEYDCVFFERLSKRPKPDSASMPMLNAS